MAPFTYRLHHEPFRKPSKNEEEYFHRQAFLSRKVAARERAQERAQEERERLKELHRNRCPRCGEKLEAFRTKRVKADQCPICGGVWLDHDTFDSLTHEKGENLSALFRYVLVDQTMGEMHAD